MQEEEGKGEEKGEKREDFTVGGRAHAFFHIVVGSSYSSSANPPLIELQVELVASPQPIGFECGGELDCPSNWA